jgi:hypothetical protein
MFYRQRELFPEAGRGLAGRLLDLCGWQSFDGLEVDATLGRLREAPENEKKALWEGWEDLATRWRA